MKKRALYIFMTALQIKHVWKKYTDCPEIKYSIDIKIEKERIPPFQAVTNKYMWYSFY